jgi:hypothetical protein
MCFKVQTLSLFSGQAYKALSFILRPDLTGLQIPVFISVTGQAILQNLVFIFRLDLSVLQTHIFICRPDLANLLTHIFIF